MSRDAKVVNARTGRIECVFVNLELIYPDPHDSHVEYCFEELRARSRGWLHRDWREYRRPEQNERRSQRPRMPAVESTTTLIPLAGGDDERSEKLAEDLNREPALVDENNPSAVSQAHDREAAKRFRREERANRTRKIKISETKAETQTSKNNFMPRSE